MHVKITGGNFVKRYIVFFLSLICIITMVGCNNAAPAPSEIIPIVMVNGELYYDTNKESETYGRCGLMDGKITSSVGRSEVPTEDNQSNFGTGYEYQYGTDGRLDILINEKWAVFEKRTEEPIPILTEPPTLTISTLDSSIEALRGTTSWLYDNGDGTQTGIESDSMHPLDSSSKEYMPTLLIMPTSYSSKNPLEAVLQFDVIPDEVSVHCWSDEHWENTSSQSEDILINDFTIELKDGGYIYEVIAHWNSSEKYGGTAYYSFYATEKINANVIPDGAENNTFTDILSLNGYYVKNEETPPGFIIWRYFAELDGKTQCITEVKN